MCPLCLDRRERPDPTKAPDPEDPSEDFSEESVTTLVQEEGKFEAPADDATITLDNCEYSEVSTPGDGFIMYSECQWVISVAIIVLFICSSF